MIQVPIEYVLLPEDAARERNMAILWPLPDELLVDLDSAAACDEFVRRVERCAALLPCAHAEAWPSRSHEHYHVSIRLTWHITERERLFLEACLGGDPMRALLAWRNMESAGEEVSCLFVPHGHPALTEERAAAEGAQVNAA